MLGFIQDANILDQGICKREVTSCCIGSCAQTLFSGNTEKNIVSSRYA